MILYKYVSFESGLKILETSALGFSHLEDFNDPFEATALGLKEGGISICPLQSIPKSTFQKVCCAFAY